MESEDWGQRRIENKGLLFLSYLHIYLFILKEYIMEIYLGNVYKPDQTFSF